MEDLEQSEMAASGIAIGERAHQTSTAAGNQLRLGEDRPAGPPCSGECRPAVGGVGDNTNRGRTW